MLTKNEISALNLSATKKDFVQIWTELLDVASKLSERWDPTSTNESDPGIVILKALTGIADKLNYNIDKNTLEAFMPTAAQEDSMRKLCDMLGYSIKYYQSATSEVFIKYHNANPTTEEADAMKDPGQLIPKFTVITNSDQDINYFTTNQTPAYISSANPSQKLSVMEGQIVKCESINDNNIITANQISTDNKYYLPETQIAENGIFIYNVFNGESFGGGLEDGDRWLPVDNLNIQVHGSKVFKFGFDAYEGRPYIEFPEDYSELFNDGIFIYYTRTSGAGGNISARTLTKFELPTGGKWGSVTPESLSVENTFAATTGANIESIKQAYNNFKKTVGTFETLVTCRDYMNKIYRMTQDEYDNRPIVSNVLVTDIRDDLNRATTICSCDDAGIFYKETALYDPTIAESAKMTKPVFNSGAWHLGTTDGIQLSKSALNPIKYKKDSEDTEEVEFIDSESADTLLDRDSIYVADNKWVIIQNGIHWKTALPAPTELKPAIEHFDLVLYPYKSYNQIKSGVSNISSVYNESFKYNPALSTRIVKELEETDKVKTVAHKFVPPRNGDILSINNYLRLNATIATTSKITTEEAAFLIDKVKIALANAFNMRELDFGEEIPFDAIIDVIEKADARIRVVSLNDPTLYTTYSVLEDADTSGNYTIKEYAVKSSWLSESAAKEASQLDTETVDEEGSYTGTYNVKQAREIYNKLAVRNILAGRLPLFNYNNVFSSSFTESPYQITLALAGTETPPKEMPEPNATNGNIVVYEKDGITYTAIYDPATQKTNYTKTYTPKEFRNNSIDTVKYDNGTKEAKISEIKTDCNILADQNNPGIITDVKLEASEFVKFRAPNFTTIKTYPAYVNYHLVLDKERLSEPENAEAETLFNILNEDRQSWSATNTNVKWQQVLDYFGNIDKSRGTTYKQTQSLSMPISKYSSAAATAADACTGAGNTTGKHVDDGTGKCLYCGQKMLGGVQTGPIVVDINEVKEDDSAEKLFKLIDAAGCVKFINSDFKARLVWTDEYGDTIPTGSTGPDLDITLDLDNPFIIDSSMLNTITEKVRTRLDEMVGQEDGSGNPLLPTECAWRIYFDFEGVPFNAESLDEWTRFVKSSDAIGYTPITELGTVLWRVYGEGYSAGKYILPSTEKLLNFASNYFGLLPQQPLQGIYLVRNLGKDAQPAIIANNEEYKLRANEYLYIEYTPSTTNADGTTQEAAAITEVHGPGTILRPAGFETGLMDSSVLESLGTSPHKTVTFETPNSITDSVSMQRFGANEQVEIRDFAKTELDKDTFKSSSSIHYYKNFTDCPELEKIEYDDEGHRINNTYTLKDGEYIFYTDNNKNELAYYTTGTQVTLEGRVVLEPANIIELSTIFDAGISEIPWKPRNFSGEDKIIFQEFQYITLGPDDTVQSIKLLEDKAKLSSNWQYCDEVSYKLAGADKAEKLPAIKAFTEGSTAAKGNGWQVCSILELDVDKNNTQVLRNDDKIQTSITLVGDVLAGDKPEQTISPVDPDQPLAFKTNLTCQSGNGKINIKDVYNNPKKLKGFSLKLFTNEGPALVKTELNRTYPPLINKTINSVTYSNVFDMETWQNWTGTPVDINTTSTAWTSIDLTKIKTQKDEEYGRDIDVALRLPVTLLPNTYGIFSVYINYQSQKAKDNAKTCIELTPGMSKTDVTLLNAAEDSIEWIEGTNPTDPLKLVLQNGINCVRVNKTCKLFIKTSEDAQGPLFFDNLRLVDCEQLKCRVKTSVTTDGVTIDEYRETNLTTQGLNIKQIGYLNPDKITTSGNLLDDEMKKNLKDSYIKDFHTELLAIEKETKQEQEPNLERLYDYQPELTSLVKLVKDFHTEVEAFAKRLEGIKSTSGNTAATDAFLNLFNKYIALKEYVAQEQSLLDILDANEDFSKINDELLRLATTFSSVETDQHELINEIQKLRVLTEDAISELTISSQDIINDFKDNNSAYRPTGDDTDDEKEARITEIGLLTKKLLEADYLAELSELAIEADRVTNSADKTQLKAALESLQQTGQTATRSELAYKLKQLTGNLDNSELSALLESMINYASVLDIDNKPQYSLLHAVLFQIKDYLYKDYRFIASELELAAADSNDALLAELLTEFKNLQVVNETDDVTSLTELINSIDSTIKTVGANLSATSKQSAITSAIVPPTSGADTSLYTRIKDYYKNTLDNIIKALRDNSTSTASGLLVDLESSVYKNALSILKTSSDTQVNAVLRQLEKLNSEFTAYNTAINNIIDNKDDEYNIQDYITDVGEYGKQAVLEYWFSFIKNDLRDQFVKKCDNLANVVLGLSLQVKDKTESYDIAFSDDNTCVKYLSKYVESYNSLSDRASELINKEKQRQERLSVLDAIGDIAPMLFDESDKLSEDKATSMVIDSDVINTLLNKLINVTGNTNYESSPLKRARIASKLKAELTDSINANNNIIDAIINIFCPKLLSFEKHLPEKAHESDNFYNTFYNYLDDKVNDESGILEYLYHTTETPNASGFVNSLYTKITAIKNDLSTALKSERGNETLGYFEKIVVSRNYQELLLFLRGFDATSDNLYVSSELVTLLSDLKANSDILTKIVEITEADFSYLTAGEVQAWQENKELTEDIKVLFNTLISNFEKVDAANYVDSGSKEAFETLLIEQRLLDDIRLTDKNKDFYYTAPVNQSIAIDFNESDEEKNTLMNPSINYDINNINNNFVISKLDIDYLDSGIQIARSSRLN